MWIFTKWSEGSLLPIGHGKTFGFMMTDASVIMKAICPDDD